MRLGGRTGNSVVGMTRGSASPELKESYCPNSDVNLSKLFFEMKS